MATARSKSSSSRDEKEIVHSGVTCDACGQKPIVGARYNCTMCVDYDLCEECEARGEHSFHSFVKLKQPDTKDLERVAAAIAEVLQRKNIKIDKSEKSKVTFTKDSKHQKISFSAVWLTYIIVVGTFSSSEGDRLVEFAARLNFATVMAYPLVIDLDSNVAYVKAEFPFNSRDCGAMTDVLSGVVDEITSVANKYEQGLDAAKKRSADLQAVANDTMGVSSSLSLDDAAKIALLRAIFSS
eukprot:TRINITY_DN34_c0_g1_i10.p1 TRINITY_DN34_c0_g1~~TRINITY_DN34_c0_g1_i10.p1  ORF type:complete len:240 (-),score=46.89 TRINITY_DN34_c0_g1_i10:350-1069(-)